MIRYCDPLGLEKGVFWRRGLVKEVHETVRRRSKHGGRRKKRCEVLRYIVRHHNILVRLGTWAFLSLEKIKAARLQNETAPEKFLNRYEKRFEKREKRSEKRSETRLKTF